VRREKMSRVSISRARLLAFVEPVAVMLLLVSCAINPIGIAQTAEQKFYATYGTYVIMEEAAGRLTSATSTLPPATQLKIVDAVQATQPVVDCMKKGFNEYTAARAEFEAQRQTASAFQVFVDNLKSWVSRAEPLVTGLAAAVRGQTGPATSVGVFRGCEEH